MTCSAGLRAATKTQQCGSVLSEPTYSVPLPSLCATFPRPGSLLQIMMGVWATPAGRTAAAVPAQPPQHWVTGRGREEEGNGGCLQDSGAAAAAGPLQCRDYSRGGAGMVLGMTPVCRAAEGGGCD